MHKLKYGFFILLFSAKCAFAQATTSLVEPPLYFSGYVDGSYNYLKNSQDFYTFSHNRAFDLNPNGLTLHQVALNPSFQLDNGFGAVVNIIVGRDPITLAPYGYTPNFFNSNNFGIDLTQLYLQEKNKSWTLTAGRFYSLIGVETTDPTKDTNFSRGIIYFLTPYTVMGVRSKYEFSPQISVIIGLNNGWDNIRDVGFSKTLEFGLSYNPSNFYSIAVQGYTGRQRSVDKTSSGPSGIRNIADAILTINPTDKLTLIADYNYGIQNNSLLPNASYGKAVWNAIGGYINYKFNEQWKISLRGEDFNDKGGNRSSIIQNWKEITLTVGYAPTSSYEIRGEIRHDFSNVDSFLAPNGITVKNNQQSFGLEGIIKFG